jgi:hypothetical protein
VDPVGSCIGLRGNRIQSIVNELQGEKIDVIEWDSNPRVLIGRALSPADVGAVELDQDENTAYVVVPESQMSLAIGRDGQNARLAARLSGWRLDIKNVEQWSALRAARAAEAARAEAVRLAEEAAAAEALAAQQAAAAARASEAAPVEPEPADIMPVAEAAKAAIAETGLVVEAPDAQVVAAAEVPAEPVVEAVIEESVDVEMGAVALAEPAIAAAQPAEVEIIDEDALLEALIAEEEADAAEAPVAASAGVGLSVDALESFTLEDVVDESDESDEFDDEEIDEEPEEEDTTDLLAGLPNLAPDAGKIRFAEDIVGDFRGGEGRRRRGGGANRRGGNVPGARGPGARRR